MTTSTAPNTSSRAARITLWTVQGLLAALFVFSGVMKFVMSVEAMTKDVALPGWFLHFIGVAEILGGLGLVLPGLLGVRRGLTPLAAIGLLIIMMGATALTFSTQGVTMAITPFIIGLLCAFVAQRRLRELRLAAQQPQAVA